MRLTVVWPGSMNWALMPKAGASSVSSGVGQAQGRSASPGKPDLRPQGGAVGEGPCEGGIHGVIMHAVAACSFACWRTSRAACRASRPPRPRVKSVEGHVFSWPAPLLRVSALNLLDVDNIDLFFGLRQPGNSLIFRLSTPEVIYYCANLGSDALVVQHALPWRLRGWRYSMTAKNRCPFLTALALVVWIPPFDYDSGCPG